MGLDTSHNAWHGSYTAFASWRREIARAAGFPPLDMMEGYWKPNNAFCIPAPEMLNKCILDCLPIQWSCIKNDPLKELLRHSDTDGYIPPDQCGAIADSLGDILPDIRDMWRAETEQFIDGLREAENNNERLFFG